MKTTLSIFILILSTTLMSQNSIQPTVDVSGEGIVRVVPDEVTINLRVENTGNDARELKRENDRIVNEVLSFLKKEKIEEKYIKTEYIRLSKNYDYNSKSYNFSANQAISVKLSDLGRYESIMDGLLTSGINRIDGISFSSSQRASLEAEARKKAVAHAKMKAEEYAGVLDQKVGKAVSIRENVSYSPPTPLYRGAMAMDASAGGEQTMAPGEMEIRVMIYISFELQ
ncbi:SIMPL domain-containing protein [Aureitalea sp. L0-47]|uniref:SIMPL domain-containing protein n=1 Tax=Aureitalea sp. L0-47 TaxID=2816962 RepID=UPI002236F0F4|nr:SIMPL domain-containing protein [Aureitalea sp. L0-47]MCW5520404.1 SIMPL domain-containing protein [Aureitalea sp. L0-47]